MKRYIRESAARPIPCSLYFLFVISFPTIWSLYVSLIATLMCKHANIKYYGMKWILPYIKAQKASHRNMDHQIDNVFRSLHIAMSASRFVVMLHIMHRMKHSQYNTWIKLQGPQTLLNGTIMSQASTCYHHCVFLHSTCVCCIDRPYHSFGYYGSPWRLCKYRKLELTAREWRKLWIKPTPMYIYTT